VVVIHLQPGMTLQALHAEEMAQHGWQRIPRWEGI
jgi:hypothetical protein